MKKNLKTLFIALLPLCSYAQNITTVAGSGYVGFSGDGGLATAATFCEPYGLWVDPSGNLLIADGFNLRIRKINAAGVINTIIGNGKWGFTGDGGPATAASTEGPNAVAADASGNLYFDDGNRIRKVSTSGIVTTIAGNGIQGYSGDGGPATAAEFIVPYALAVDTKGNVYVSDFGNSTIRKIDTAGIITTIAGNGTGGYYGDGGPAIDAVLFWPWQITIDASDNIYIADFGNGRIRKIDTAGIITTVAGDGTSGSAGDGGPATAAELTGPIGVAFDPAGNMYIADYDNNNVRKVDTAGIITTYAGTGTPGYTGDGGPASAAQLNELGAITSDATGNIYLIDDANFRVRKINTAGIISTIAGAAALAYSGDGGPATAAQFIYPYDIALDDSHNMYVVDGSRIRKINTSGVVTSIAGNGIAGYTGDGGPADTAELNAPSSVAIDAAGNVYVCDQGNNRIRKINTSGIITTIAGNGTAGYSGDGGPADTAELYSPSSITMDASGNLYIADFDNNRIRKINTSGIITTIAGNGTAGYTGDGGPATTAELNAPISIAIDVSGNLFFSDYRNNRVRKISTSGIITTIAGNGTGAYTGDGGPATAAGINTVYGITIDADNNVYISQLYNATIRKIDTSGIITTIAGNGIWAFAGDGGPAGNAEMHNPAGIALDNSGNMFVCDIYNGRIREIDSVADAGIISVNPNTLADVRIYPNPTSSTFTISSTQNINSVMITNIIGQKLYYASCNDKNVVINIDQFTAGVYLVMINGINAYKLIKQ